MSRTLKAVAVAAVLLASVPLETARASNDPFFSLQWSLAKIGVPSAWQRSTGRGITVAVLDTGVDRNHPDLRGKVLPGRDLVDPRGHAQDVNGHGTHMAGTIAADTANGIGIAGVAPDAKILPVRVLDAGGESNDPAIVAAGIRWAADHGANVLNLSLAEDGPGGGAQSGDLLSDRDIDDAIVYASSKGEAVVIAAGNTDGGGRGRTSYVADVPGAIVVGASTIDDRRAAYSNYGSGLDVLAPGGGSAIDPSFSHGCTQSNSVIGLFWDPKTHRSDYAGACGTSVAVAHVSGVLALLMARGYSAANAVLRLEQTTVDLGPRGRDPQTGWGRIDAARALGPGPALHGPTSATRPPAVARAGATAPPPSGTATPGTLLARGAGTHPARTAPIVAALVLAASVGVAQRAVRSRRRSA